MNAARQRSGRRQPADRRDDAEALRGILTLIQWQQQIIQDLLQRLDGKVRKRRA